MKRFLQISFAARNTCGNYKRNPIISLNNTRKQWSKNTKKADRQVNIVVQSHLIMAIKVTLLTHFSADI